MNNSGTALARLRVLIGQAGSNYFERISIASDLLDNQEWLLVAYQGDAFDAANMLEKLYFHDLCGAMTIWEILHIYQKFPTEKKWEAHKYNLKKMHALCNQIGRAHV